jgi:hypothetical protein
MFLGARQLFAVWLLSISGAWIGHTQASIPTSQPADLSRIIADSDGNVALGYAAVPVLIDADDANPPAPAANPGPTTQPLNPQVLNNPLPPAFWSGMAMLVLASVLVAWRRLRRQLR